MEQSNHLEGWDAHILSSCEVNRMIDYIEEELESLHSNDPYGETDQTGLLL